MPDIGGSLITIALLVWVSIAVGPWWIGLCLFVFGFVANLIWHKRESARHTRDVG